MRNLLNKNTKWVFTLPTIVFVTICMGYPMIYSIYMSLQSWEMSLINKPVFIGFANYASVLSDSRFWNAVKFTFRYFAVSSLLEVTIGVLLALMLNRIRKCQGLIRTIFLFPMVATPIAMGYVWKIMFDSSLGILNRILKFFGMKAVTWLGAKMVFKSLMIMEVWHGTPLIILIVLAGLTGINRDMYESAKIDGASAFQQTIYITLPLLSPTIIMAFLLRGIELLKIYDVISALTGGGPNHATENLNMYVYTTAFEYMQMGEACALMIVFFLIVMTFSLICMGIKKRIEARYLE